MLDLLLAGAHHLLIFALFATLLTEFLQLRSDLDRATVLSIARVDLLYGVSAALLLIVGFSRAVFATKGWPYYSHNIWFYAKLAAFALIGILSIFPTRAILRWRRSGRLPDSSAIRAVRRLLHYELALFVLLPLFAAAMARGYGEF